MKLKIEKYHIHFKIVDRLLLIQSIISILRREGVWRRYVISRQSHGLVPVWPFVEMDCVLDVILL